jgi:hypothetical protein
MFIVQLYDYNVGADINKWGDVQIDHYKIVRTAHYKV